ncbi:MAG: hypothetical protein DRR16_27955 [Candidatus Parabeggiatoa sp. nov. 3]|nr:MAG: hypothetical protein DRR00_30695 [Gammaproteobacteria bacterium]RKZ60055.1 MAG: hypothetical protein DRQ99_22735 [Gammaproteobacteria bacterium]RKZ78301.1 MAG: hypothetical protein DRR16_27955 [Gammaproteobacteria bacterium]
MPQLMLSVLFEFMVMRKLEIRFFLRAFFQHKVHRVAQSFTERVKPLWPSVDICVLGVEKNE